MPVTYTIDASAKLIHTKCAGDVMLDEVIGHFRTLYDDPACPSQLDVLLDLAEMGKLPNGFQLQTVSYEIRRVRERVRFGFCAVIAPRAALFGMLRVFAVMAQDYFREIRVCRSAAEATEWLNASRATSNHNPKP
jgi:hypothetical protein